jgi:hypothetical protein
MEKGYTKLRIQFVNFGEEFLKRWKMNKEIKSKKAFYRALGGKVMANYFKVFDFLAKACNRFNFNYRDYNYSAGGGNLDIFPAQSGIVSYGNGCFNRNYCIRGSGIHSHFDYSESFWPLYLDVKGNHTVFDKTFKKLRHSLLGTYPLNTPLRRVFHISLIAGQPLRDERYGQEATPSGGWSFFYPSFQWRLTAILSYIFCVTSQYLSLSYFITSGIEDSIFHGTSQGCVSKLVLRRTRAVGRRTRDEGRRTKDEKLTIDVAAMADADYMNNALLDVNFINNTVIAFAQGITAFFRSCQRFAQERMQCEGIYGFC